jgi:hypothetical protein
MSEGKQLGYKERVPNPIASLGAILDLVFHLSK